MNEKTTPPIHSDPAGEKPMRIIERVALCKYLPDARYRKTMTLGKIYDVLDADTKYVKLENDKGKIYWYPHSMFNFGRPDPTTETGRTYTEGEMQEKYKAGWRDGYDEAMSETRSGLKKWKDLQDGIKSAENCDEK